MTGWRTKHCMSSVSGEGTGGIYRIFYELLCNEVRLCSRTLYIENNFTKREAYTRTPPFLAKKRLAL